ncbi:MAG: transcription elongation factor GreA [Chloroflexi bacterium]|jgi:transcription elongation factor GreA|nr:MAG: transcription elongation factor GreA [Chloroflexota bacterium]
MLEQLETLTVIEAISKYLNNPRTKTDGPHTETELGRFVQYYGSDRVLKEIDPAEVGSYSERITDGGAVPQAAEKLQVIRGFLSYMRKSGHLQVNLAQHVRIKKNRVRNNKPSDGSQEIIELTPDGHKQLNSELETLKLERPRISEDIHKAAQDKDVKENAPLEAAREQQAHIESRITNIELQLRNAVVIDPKKRKKDARVGIGAKVTLKDLVSGKEQGYTVVSVSESNPLQNKISNVSPVGKAVMKRVAGQQIEVNTPLGKQSFLIVKVSA